VFRFCRADLGVIWHNWSSNCRTVGGERCGSFRPISDDAGVASENGQAAAYWRAHADPLMQHLSATLNLLDEEAIPMDPQALPGHVVYISASVGPALAAGWRLV